MDVPFRPWRCAGRCVASAAPILAGIELQDEEVKEAMQSIIAQNQARMHAQG
jgi:hypothetical protein